MNLYGDTVLLRAIDSCDCELLLSMINDPETESMLGGWSFPVSFRQQEKWIDSLPNDKHTLRCIIQPLTEEKGIGTVMLTEIDYKNGNAEIHIKLANTDVRKKGYGADTINTVVKYAFEQLRLHVVYARVNATNLASAALFRKCGFEFEGELKERIYKNGTYLSVLSFVRVCNEK